MSNRERRSVERKPAGNTNELNRARDSIKSEVKCAGCEKVTKDRYYYDNCKMRASCLKKAR